MLLTIIGIASTNHPDLKPPADMPKVPALMGSSLIVYRPRVMTSG